MLVNSPGSEEGDNFLHGDLVNTGKFFSGNLVFNGKLFNRSLGDAGKFFSEDLGEILRLSTATCSFEM